MEDKNKLKPIDTSLIEDTIAHRENVMFKKYTKEEMKQLANEFIMKQLKEKENE